MDVGPSRPTGTTELASRNVYGIKAESYITIDRNPKSGWAPSPVWLGPSSL